MQDNPPALAIRLLGGIEVRVQGEPLPKLRSRQGLRLLALLALRAPRELERRFVAGMLWPDTTEDDGLGLLRRTLTDLRRALGATAEWVVSPSRHTLQLVLGHAIWIDTHQLEASLTQGESLDDALALYRGPLLEGLHDEWVIGERERYQLLFLEALERRATHVRPVEATVLLRRALLLDPLREKSLRALLEALAAQGDTAGLTSTYQQFRRSLRRLLESEPDETTTLLYRRLLRTSAQRVEKPTRHAVSALPLPLTLFFGRDDEARHLNTFLERPNYRLITLTGLGGVGKTRLATEAVRIAQVLFPGGIYFLPLAELTEPGQVLTTLAQLLNVVQGAESGLLERVLVALTQTPQRCLLVLDNLEHLLAHPDSARLLSMVQQLLERASSLTCLATSRIALRLSGERELPVPPLALAASVALFRDRAQSLRPEWELTETTLPQVQMLCQMLEGSPLAIELAAGALRVLPLSQVLHRLEKRLDLMADRRLDVPERHRSLRAVLEGSYQLLPPKLQHFFADLSVFRGGWCLLAASAVGEAHLEALEALRVLEEHSLVRLVEGNEGRFVFQEVVREFAAERLSEQGRADGTQKRHAIYFSQLATEVTQGLLGPEQAHWHQVMDQDYENVRAALDNLAGHPTEENIAHYLEFIASLSRFWERRSYFREAYQRCLTGVQLHGTRPLTSASARALLRIGVHCWRQHELVRSQDYTRQALAYYEAIGDFASQCDAYQNLGNVVHLEGDNTEAERLFTQGLELARCANDPYRIASLLGNLGFIAAAEGRLGEAVELYDEQLALRRTLGDLGRVARSLSHLGATTTKRGDFDRARRYFAESLILHRQFKNDFSIASDLFFLGEIAQEHGEYSEAWQFYVEALEYQRYLGLHQDLLSCLDPLAQVALRLGQPLMALRLWAALEVATQKPHPALEETRALCCTTFGNDATHAAELAGRITPLEKTVQGLLDAEQERQSTRGVSKRILPFTTSPE